MFLSLECFCAVTSADIQKKVAMGTGKKRKVLPEDRLSVEKVADRFNQVTVLTNCMLGTFLISDQYGNYFTSYCSVCKTNHFGCFLVVPPVEITKKKVPSLHTYKIKTIFQTDQFCVLTSSSYRCTEGDRFDSFWENSLNLTY